LDCNDEHIINAEKILHDYDMLQEGEANIIAKNIENFIINKNLDLFNSNLNNFCNFISPFIDNLNSNINNNKEIANEFESKFCSDLLNIHNQFENINLGHLDLPELNKKLFSKNISNENNEKKISSKTNKLELNQKNYNKNDKESVVSQLSMINSNSTLNNNLAMLQTDSSFFSAYDENFINNKFKGNKFFKFFL